MNLYDYFKTKDEFIKLNQFFIYKKLIDFNSINSLLKRNPKLELFNFNELELFLKYRPTKIKSIINQITDNKAYIFLRNMKGEPSKKNMMIFKDDKFELSYYEDVESGIVFLKPKKELIKNYNDLKDLVEKNPNVALYTNLNLEEQNKQDDTTVICYDNLLIDELTNEEKDFTFPILFSGNLRNTDLLINKIAKKGSIIASSSSRSDVSGRYILYPILTYFSNNKKIMPDRDALTNAAKSVWKDLFFNDKIFNKYSPIDDYERPITIKDNSDDGRIYRDEEERFTNILYNKNNFINLSLEQQLKILKNKREHDPYNWVYELKNESKVKQIVEILIERHDAFLKEKINKDDFEINLKNMAKDFFRKRYES